MYLVRFSHIIIKSNKPALDNITSQYNPYNIPYSTSLLFIFYYNILFM